MTTGAARRPRVRDHRTRRRAAIAVAFTAVVAGGTWLEASRAPVAATVAGSDGTTSGEQSGEQSERSGEQSGQTPLGGDPEAGRRLYVAGCVSCHGTEGQGVEGRGPDLENAGAASAHFYLTSGRMPASTGTGDQPLRKPPAYDPEEIADLVAHVATLGEGPAIPELDLEGADLALGQQLYTANCAGCHNSAGSGGALGKGTHAPAVTRATPLEVAEAIRVGPGAMPSFSEGVLDQDELNAVVHYVDELRNPDTPGGFSLGRIGPVTEGMVAWLVGMVLLLAAARWIGSRE